MLNKWPSTNRQNKRPINAYCIKESNPEGAHHFPSKWQESRAVSLPMLAALCPPLPLCVFPRSHSVLICIFSVSPLSAASPPQPNPNNKTLDLKLKRYNILLLNIYNFPKEHSKINNLHSFQVSVTKSTHTSSGASEGLDKWYVRVTLILPLLKTCNIQFYKKSGKSENPRYIIAFKKCFSF